MNHAPSKPSPKPPAFSATAVKVMSIDDARSILTGTNNAATQYFRRTTETNLSNASSPSSKRPPDQTGVTASYKQLMDKAGSSSLGSFATPFFGANRSTLTPTYPQSPRRPLSNGRRRRKKHPPKSRRPHHRPPPKSFRRRQKVIRAAPRNIARSILIASLIATPLRLRSSKGCADAPITKRERRRECPFRETVLLVKRQSPQKLTDKTPKTTVFAQNHRLCSKDHRLCSKDHRLCSFGRLLCSFAEVKTPSPTAKTLQIRPKMAKKRAF